MKKGGTWKKGNIACGCLFMKFIFTSQSWLFHIHQFPAMLFFRAPPTTLFAHEIHNIKYFNIIWRRKYLFMIKYQAHKYIRITISSHKVSQVNSEQTRAAKKKIEKYNNVKQTRERWIEFNLYSYIRDSQWFLMNCWCEPIKQAKNLNKVFLFSIELISISPFSAQYFLLCFFQRFFCISINYDEWICDVVVAHNI